MACFFNPFRGFPLKRGAKGVSIFNLVVAVTLTFIEFYKLDGDLIASDMEDTISSLNLHHLHDETHQEQVEDIFRELSATYHKDIIVITTLSGLAFLAGDIWLAVKLWRASNTENTKVSLVWMGVRGLYIAFSIFGSIFYIVDTDSETIITWIALVVSFVQIYGILIVNEFRKEILATGPVERI